MSNQTEKFKKAWLGHVKELNLLIASLNSREDITKLSNAIEQIKEVIETAAKNLEG